ncbi:MAG: hypothetical protein JXD19_12875 [Deltaproteobacteria bacterium]|nr:hypothetical protein [Deltaproteobacteria bacterium]
MAQKPEEQKKAFLEVVVDLKDLTEKHGWPKLGAYLFTKSGRFLDRKPLEKDPESLTTGRARFEIPAKKDMLVVKVGPDVENIYELKRHQPVADKVLVDPEKTVTKPFYIDMKKWWCWLHVPYVVTGTVEKDEGDYNTPICHGQVDIYEVDIRCLLWLDAKIIEKIRAAVIDLIINPPRLKLPEIPVWPDWEDNEYCGTVPRPPFPPKNLDIREKLEKLPPEWAFATERYEKMSTAAERMDACLLKMDLSEKQTFLRTEVLEGVPVSKVLYSNTDQFRELLVDKFQAFRFWLCWYPWIHWLWWPHCWYSLKKIGTAEIQPDGSFTETVWISVCDHDTPDLWFVVRQKIGGTERTIFKRYPVPCHTYWNHPSGDPVNLVVTDPNAVTCYQEPPTDLDPAGYWIVPLAIGNYSLKRIYGTGAGTLPTTNADPKTGLYESIYTAIGGSLSTFYEGPFGGRLGLRYLFSSTLESAGVKYYRVKYRSNGAGDWIALDHKVVRHYSDYDPVTDTLNFPAYELGPYPVGTENNLFEIPPIDPPNKSTDSTATWVVLDATVDLMNGYLRSTEVPNGYAEFKIELFNSSGARVDPATFGTTGISFKLPANNDIWNTVTTTDPTTVNSDLLVADPEDSAFQTFIFRLVIDNRQPTAVIDEPVVNPSGNKTDDCGMIRYEPTDTSMTMTYQVRHAKKFAMYRFRIFRAATLLHTIEGQAGDLGPSGSFTVDPGHTGISLLANLMGGCPEAAFSENLYVWNMAYNGWHRVGPDASAVRAFALTPPRP